MNQDSRVILNTIILYAKVVVTSVIALVSTRYVLSYLGSEDFGIYNLVSGVVVMLSFINLAMTTSTLRFTAYYIGKRDREILRKVFNTSIILHIFLAVFIMLILFILGKYFINNFLEIPEGRIFISEKVFNFAVIGAFITIISVPYDSIINAHENMLFFSIISIIESFLKLFIALFMVYIDINQRLIYYSLLIAIIPFCSLIIKSIYCSKKYDETKLNLHLYNFDLIKKMFSFASWNIFGAFSNVARNQGVAMALNMFYGVIINTSYGIANQLNGILSVFSGSLQKALNPLIMKSEGAGERKKMLYLALMQCKISIFLLSIIAIPLIIEMPSILKFWLSSFPNYTVEFCRLVLVLSIISQFTTGIQVAIQSVGKISIYQITMGSLLFLNLPLSFLLLKHNFSPSSVLICAIVIEAFSAFIRLLFARKLVELNVIDYINTVLKPASSILLGIALLFLFSLKFEIDYFLSLLVFYIIGITIMSLSIYFVGLNLTEKKILLKKIKIFKNKLHF